MHRLLRISVLLLALEMAAFRYNTTRVLMFDIYFFIKMISKSLFDWNSGDGTRSVNDAPMGSE